MSFISYAQNYEDVILARAFRDVAEGMYIDVGAQDPRFDSVTKAFYDRGWRGVNIEPAKYWHARLVEDRPRDINLWLAAGASSGSIDLHETDESGLSTTVAEFAQRHRDQGHELHSRRVPMSTLDAIWAEHVVAEVHFLKIDVEGAEADVLRGIDLAVRRPWVIVVEATEPNSRVSTHGQWESLLTGRGYRFVYEDGLNRFYLANEHADLSEAFRLPPNFFDYFVRREQVDEANDLRRHIAGIDELSHRRAEHIDRVEALQAERERAMAALLDYQVAAEENLVGLRAALAGREASLSNLQSTLDERDASLQEQREHIDQLVTAIAQAQSSLEETNAELSAVREVLAETEASLAEHRARAEALGVRLDQSERSSSLLSRSLIDSQAARLAASAGWTAALSAHAATLETLQQTQADYRRVMASRSWRLTSPLRKASTALMAARAHLAALARNVARSPSARGTVAWLLRPFPALAAGIKRRLFGEPPPDANAPGAPAPLPLSRDAEAILARFPAIEVSGSDGEIA